MIITPTLMCLLAQSVSEGQHGVILKQSTVSISTYSSSERDVLVFDTVVVNSSDFTLLNARFYAVVSTRNGTSFPVEIRCGQDCPRWFGVGASFKASRKFLSPWPFKPEEVTQSTIQATDGLKVIEKSGERFSGFIAKDIPCFKDYAQTKLLAGLMLRKKVSELLEYGCISAVETPLEVTVKLGADIVIIGTSKVKIVHILLSDDRYRVGLTETQSSSHLADGWVSADSLTRDTIFGTEPIH